MEDLKSLAVALYTYKYKTPVKSDSNKDEPALSKADIVALEGVKHRDGLDLMVALFRSEMRDATKFGSVRIDIERLVGSEYEIISDDFQMYVNILISKYK